MFDDAQSSVNQTGSDTSPQRPQGGTGQEGEAHEDPTHTTDRQEEHRCGPDVTDWFFEELIAHWNYSVTQYNSHGWWRFHSPSSYSDFAKYANSLDYKFMSFVSANCPRQCAGTVLLCGSCIDKSELGNIMFGIVGRVWGFYYYQLRAGVWWKGAGLKQAWDKAAAELGYDAADDHAQALTASAASMCQTFKASPKWAHVQAPNAVDCPDCADIWTGPHSTPGIPCSFPGVPAHG